MDVIAGATKKRVRRPSTRVVVYVLLAGVLFADVGYQQVWQDWSAVRAWYVKPSGSSALSQAFPRIGVPPLAELSDWSAGRRPGSPRWHGLLVCAIGGTPMFFRRATPTPSPSVARPAARDAPGGYSMLRLVTIVACGTRTVLDAVFGS